MQYSQGTGCPAGVRSASVGPVMPENMPISSLKVITAADGYVDLKMGSHAERELSLVPAELHTSIEYRRVECRVLMLHDNWQEAHSVAAGICDETPDDPGGWVILAYTARRALSIEKARELLIEAMPRFSDDGIFPYNLGCYECQLGNLDAAREYLTTAFSISPEYHRLALQDEDLEVLWRELGGG